MHKLYVSRGFTAAALIVLVLSIVLVPRAAAAQDLLPGGYFREVRWIETAEIGVEAPTGLAYSAAGETLLVLSERKPDRVAHVGLYLEDLVAEEQLAVPVASPLSTTFDNQLGRLLLVDPSRRALVSLEARPGQPWTEPDGPAQTQGKGRMAGALGITLDPQAGRVYAVDADGTGISVIGSANSDPVRLSLRRGAGKISLRGIAFNPVDRHLYALDPRLLMLYEFSETGEALSARDLKEVGLREPQAMVFAPSGDNTDDPAVLSLYIADNGVDLPGGGILELSMTEPNLVDFQLMAKTATLVRTIDLSRWSPPAPDPSGIGYWPANGTLLVADSEVEEMPPYYTGKNVFEATISGGLLRTYGTTAYSKEPVGSAVNPANNHVFFSDDNLRRVFEINIGVDGLLGTADDTRWYFSTSAVGSNDPEGIGFGDGKLFIADGTGSEVYVISPGPNNRFDGVAPAGDDQLITHFDTSAYGISDPEGIDYNPDTGTVFIAGNSSRRYLLEMTPYGALVERIDISSIPSMAPAGVAAAPGSTNPAVRSIYISDRRVDNGSDPYENDGRVYEVRLSGGSAATSTLTATPTRTLTPTQAFTPTRTATATATRTATATHTATSTLTATVPPTQTQTPTNTQTAAATQTATATQTPTVTSQPVQTETPTATPTLTPTITATLPAEPTATFTATLDPTVNLALNRPVTVSSIDPNNNGMGENAVDGNLSTRWKSLVSGTLPAEWIIVDLGQAEEISRVVLRWNYYATAYTIDVSNDGQVWTTVFSTTTGNGDPDEITFSPVSARYVRMYSTAWYRSNQRIYLREFEIYH